MFIGSVRSGDVWDNHGGIVPTSAGRFSSALIFSALEMVMGASVMMTAIGLLTPMEYYQRLLIKEGVMMAAVGTSTDTGMRRGRRHTNQGRYRNRQDYER